jgi:DNA mismatch endonuclease, patch repair protein
MLTSRPRRPRSLTAPTRVTAICACGREWSSCAIASRSSSRPRPLNEATGARLRHVRRENTKPEIGLRRELWARGLRYRLHRRVLPGLRRTADIVFPTQRIAVYVHGCFWHGCPIHQTFPKNNETFWSEKIARNRERDADTVRRLSDHGWLVITVWEHQDIAAAATQIVRAVVARTASG